MIRSPKIAALLAGIIAGALAAPAAAQEGPGPIPPMTSGAGSANYRVGANDVLEVTVFQEEELARTVQIAQDGSIALGLIGAVHVEGLTAKQIQDKLQLLYKEYLKHPQVFVTIKEYKSHVIQVFGAVRNPGQHRLTGPSRVLDVLSQIGGPSEAGGSRLVLLRRIEEKGGRNAGDDGEVFETIDIDMHGLMAEGDTSQNHEVRSGDVLFVPRADEVYVLGEVKNPGAVKFEQGLTVTQAISKVAGFTRIASRRIQVVRLENGAKKRHDVNVGRIEGGKDKDFVLQARDLIVVPESIF